MKCASPACINLTDGGSLCEYHLWLRHGPMVWLKPGRTVLGAAGDMAEKNTAGSCVKARGTGAKGRTATQRNWGAFRLRGSPV